MHLTIKKDLFSMRKTAFLLTLLIPHLVVANPTLKPNTDKQRVAVIELKNDADLKEREVLSLTETARGVVAERLGRKYLVMTRENILSLVDEQTCNDAMAKSCEVEMGRTLGAHFIVSGAVTRLGGVLKVALKVHSTKDSRLLGVREGETQTLEGLAREIKGVAESAVRLIDGSTHKRDDAVSRELDALQESSNQLSANLELLKAQEEPQEEVAVDDDFQREIARLEVDAKERKAHKEQVARDFQKVREVALKNPKKGEVAIRLFMKEYGTHRLGNPSAVAAQSLLEEVLARLESEKRARLLKVHEANVRTAWLEAKPLVEKGGAKGEQALNLFLKAYENHPLGNPFESEARETLKVANFDKENKARAEHHKQVKAEWDRVSLLVKEYPVLASKAIDLFLDRYKNHPLGNPLESEARMALGVKAGGAADGEVHYRNTSRGDSQRHWQGDREMSLYVSRVSTLIQRQFSPPATISQREIVRLTAHIYIKLNEQGKVEGTPRWVERSGNSFFDDAAMRAISLFMEGGHGRLSLPYDAEMKRAVLSQGLTVLLSGAD